MNVDSCMCVCVSPPVPPEDPVVDGSPELLLMAGTPYNLTCVTRGAKPAAHIQWTKDGVAVEGAHQSTVTHTLPCTYADTRVQVVQHQTRIKPLRVYGTDIRSV